MNGDATAHRGTRPFPSGYRRLLLVIQPAAPQAGSRLSDYCCYYCCATLATNSLGHIKVNGAIALFGSLNLSSPLFLQSYSAPFVCGETNAFYS